MSNCVTLIVATFGKKNITTFISSLRSARIYPDKRLEIIIADNSNDPSDIKFVNSYCRKNKLIHTSAPKYGKAHALNMAILKASNEILIFTDDKVTITDRNWIGKLIYPFSKHRLLGWVSGNVQPSNLNNTWSIMWETKGGLSKGKKNIYWSRRYLKSPNSQPILYFKMCAGANSAIRKEVFCKVGPWNILLDSGSKIGAGSTSEFGYRMAKKGYELCYVSDCSVNHPHPSSVMEIKRKLLVYGQGDTAQYFSLFLRFGDKLMLYQALIGHLIYTVNKFKLRLEGKYSLPISFLIFSVYGNLFGPLFYLMEYLRNLRSLAYYEQDFLEKINNLSCSSNN